MEYIWKELMDQKVMKDMVLYWNEAIDSQYEGGDSQKYLIKIMNKEEDMRLDDVKKGNKKKRKEGVTRRLAPTTMSDVLY